MDAIWIIVGLSMELLLVITNIIVQICQDNCVFLILSVFSERARERDDQSMIYFEGIICKERDRYSSYNMLGLYLSSELSFECLFLISSNPVIH